jgi:hypothetical protein
VILIASYWGRKREQYIITAEGYREGLKALHGATSIMNVIEKHKGEAREAGLILLGASMHGRGYRQFRFITCGHVVDLQTSNVRRGNLRCGECLEIRLRHESSASGLTLLEKSPKGSTYRSYLVNACGHKADFQHGHVRTGNIRCQACIEEEYAKAAQKVGLLLVGPSELGGNYRLYGFESCGHVQDINSVHAKRGNFKCRKCLEDKIEQEAKAIGLILLSRSALGHVYRRYRFSICGHEDDFQVGHIRRGAAVCRACHDAKLNSEADKAGLKLVGESSLGCLYRQYLIKACGHIRDFRLDSVRAKNIRCVYCFEEKLSREASLLGLRIVGNSCQGSNYRTYLLPCGHKGDFKTGHIRDLQTPTCERCGFGHYAKLGAIIYLVRLHHPIFGTAYKVGGASKLEIRKRSGGLFTDVACEVLGVWGRIDMAKIGVVRIEKKMHRGLKHLRHPNAKSYLSSGHTEIYRLDSLGLLINAISSSGLNNLSQQSA